LVVIPRILLVLSLAIVAVVTARSAFDQVEPIDHVGMVEALDEAVVPAELSMTRVAQPLRVHAYAAPESPVSAPDATQVFRPPEGESFVVARS
jgi:hypothetical protein